MISYEQIQENFSRNFPNQKYSLSDIQKKCIKKVVEGTSTLCIMPTGGGKSSIYWESSIELGGCAIVIFPLIALIEEQKSKLEKEGVEVLALHSGVKNQMQLMLDFAHKKINPRFIFASPEKLACDGLLEYCIKQRKDDVHLVVIDEVHCVSQWGDNFRPFYKRIPNFLNDVFGEKWPKILAMTATLNAYEIKDICDSFKVSKNNICKDRILFRPNIHLVKEKISDENTKTEKLWRLLSRHKGEKTLVYVYRKYFKRGIVELSEDAIAHGFKATAFHGDMDAQTRMDIVEKFKNNDIDVVFATNAFGMGIDIPDIRVVIHFMIPESLEQYYQEVGRSARDGKDANAYLLYSAKNIDIRRNFFIKNSYPTPDELTKCYKTISDTNGDYVPLNFQDDELLTSCFPYFIEAGLIEYVCKGFSSFSGLKQISNPELMAIYKSTSTQNFVFTLFKNKDLTPKKLTELVYSSIVNGQASIGNTIDKCIIVKKNKDTIEQSDLDIIAESIEKKINYRNGLLDLLLLILEKCSKSNQIHQEIGKYLGMNKFDLPLVYTTKNGIPVRSMSEVLIANMLYDAGIHFNYEEELHYSGKQAIIPDFTIRCAHDKILCWEHVGMLGVEEYDENWDKKTKIYDELSPNIILEKTYDGGSLSIVAAEKIEKIKKMI